MKKFKFKKQMVLSSTAPKDINVLWVNIDEYTGKIETIKEFNKKGGYWETILNPNYEAGLLTNSISEITIPDDITILESNPALFTRLDSLKKVIIPSSVTLIREHVFANDHNLQEVIFNEGLNAIYPEAFSSTALTNITFPETLSVVHGAAFGSISSFNGNDYLKITVKSNTLTLDGEVFLFTLVDLVAEDSCTELIFNNTAVGMVSYIALENIIQISTNTTISGTGIHLTSPDIGTLSFYVQEGHSLFDDQEQLAVIFGCKVYKYTNSRADAEYLGVVTYDDDFEEYIIES